jgi:tetratricopeptide (TPR) repeat protein
MNSRVVLIAALLLCLAPVTHAATAEDRYVEIYTWIEQADALLNEGQLRLAAEKYRDAQTALKDLQKNHPAWHPRILSFRLDYVAGKLAQLGPQAPSPAPPPTKTDKPAQPVTTPDAGIGKWQDAPQQIAWLTKQNALLEARLKEALSVQPAVTDPRELARAEEKIRQLQKEKDLLAVTLEQERSSQAKAAAAPSRQAEEKNRQLEAQLAAALAGTKAAQAETRDALEARDALAKKLDKTNRELEKASRDLRQRADRNSSRNHKELEKQLEAAQARLAAYETKAVPLTPEEQALVKQAEVKVAAAAPPPAAPAPPDNGTPAKRRLTLPPGAGALFAEAERAIDAGRYAEAEAKLRDILRQDATNVRILFKLAAVLMDQDKTSEAETILNTALSLEPDDPGSLYLLGSLKLRQEKYDDALTLLSRSARGEPDMPQTQYFLGRVLFHKGQRAPAEAALRKAIQLKPAWGEPHYLLAVIYGTQQPIYRELARFHYKKAIAGGAARNPDLEARIDNGSAALKR